MIQVNKENPLSRFNVNPPTDVVSIRIFENNAGFQLPHDYTQFLLRADGGEGFVGNAYAIFWRLEELLEMNKAYKVDEFAPGLFLFGSDGGGEAFAFDMRTEVKQIVSVPFVGMELESARPLGSNFMEFLEILYES